MTLRYVHKGYLYLFLISLLLFPTALFAQEQEEQSSQAADVLSETVDIDEETGEILDLTLQEVQIEEPTRVPSTLGIWFKTMRENVSIALTRDPVKKAEKQLKFAEERQRLAQFIVQNSDNERAQEKAQRMMQRAEKLFTHIDENKDKWIELEGERMRRLAKNLATHQVRRERVLDKLEELLPEKHLERIYEQRERMHKRAEKLLETFEERGISDDVRAHAARVRHRVQRDMERFEDFREQYRELQDRHAQGGDGAQNDLERLLKNRHDQVRDRVGHNGRAEERLENVKDRLEQRAAGEGEDAEAAARLLERIEQTEERVEERQEQRQERREEQREQRAAREPAEDEGDAQEVQEVVEEQEPAEAQPRRARQEQRVLRLLGDDEPAEEEDDAQEESAAKVEQEDKNAQDPVAKPKPVGSFKAEAKQGADIPSLEDAAGSRKGVQEREQERREQEREEQESQNRGSGLNIRQRVLPLNNNVNADPGLIEQDRGDNSNDSGGTKPFLLEPIPLNTGPQLFGQ